MWRKAEDGMGGEGRRGVGGGRRRAHADRWTDREMKRIGKQFSVRDTKSTNLDSRNSP